MSYDRKIKYVDAYEDGEKIQNVGFVKLEAVEDKVNIQVHIAGLKYVNSEECLVMVKGEEAEAVLRKIRIEQGRGSMDAKGLPTQKVAEGISYDELAEIYINLSEGTILRCIVREMRSETEEVSKKMPEEKVEKSTEERMDEERENTIGKTEELSEAELLREAFVQERRMLEESAYEQEAENVEVLREEEQVHNKVPVRIIQEKSTEESMAADKWQQLWMVYPHMTPFEDGREYLVVKPQDFVLLPNKYYGLSSNSFLLHGYYNYEHLILCKEKKKGEECYYIGVPGNFYEKEKQVAVLFGFECFEGKREPAGNGDFGYYMVRVEI